MSDPKPVLSDEQLRTLLAMRHPEGIPVDPMLILRAIERAVLEAVGGQYDALNRGIIADLAPVNGQPHSYARGAALEAVDTINALRARVAELERENAGLVAVAKSWEEQRDAARRELVEARVQREMLVERLVSVRMTDWLKKRDGNFTNAESIEAEKATREGIENWLRKDRAALDRAREGK